MKNQFSENDQALIDLAQQSMKSQNYQKAISLLLTTDTALKHESIKLMLVQAYYANEDYVSAFDEGVEIEPDFYRDVASVKLLLDITIKTAQWTEGWKYIIEWTKALTGPASVELQRLYDRFFDELNRYMKTNALELDILRAKIKNLTTLNIVDQSDVVRSGLKLGLPFIQEDLGPLLKQVDVNPLIKSDIVGTLAVLADSKVYDYQLFDQYYQIVPNQLKIADFNHIIEKMQLQLLNSDDKQDEMLLSDFVATATIEFSIILPIFSKVVTDPSEWAHYIINDFKHLPQPTPTAQLIWYEKIKSFLANMG